jgi:Centromere DNA-binding protein complex CBF3 subunit, domain 2
VIEESNRYPHPRGPLIRAFVDDIHIKRADVRRAAFEDRAIAGLKDGYTDKEFLNLSECLLGRQIDGRTVGDEKALRTRLDMLLMHCMMLRSETTRAAELSDFESILLTNEGPEDAFAVVMRQHGGKTMNRKDGSTNRKTHYHGFLRNKNALLCPVGALAMWFFYRWEIFRETPPDFRSRESWYQLPLLPKSLKTPETGLSFETQSDWIRRVFEEVDISSTKLLHTFRKSTARAMDLAEVPLDQVSCIDLGYFS